jgi:hypothetical protein
MSHGMSGTMAKVAGSLQHCTLWRDCELVAQRMVLDSTVSRDEPFFARHGCLFLLFFSCWRRSASKFVTCALRVYGEFHMGQRHGWNGDEIIYIPFYEI